MKQEARDGIMNRGAWSARRKVAPLVMLAVAVGMAFAAGPVTGNAAASAAPSQQEDRRRSDPLLPPEPSPTAVPLTPKQKKALLQDNFDKMKRQADELAQLAKSLQATLDKSNPNVLSLQVVDQAERIEKLAKKIKSAATVY